jgi:hypothetical protein
MFLRGVIKMRSFSSLLLLFSFSVCSGFASVGDIICNFQIPNPDSIYQYKGLARDMDDSNIWVAYAPNGLKAAYAKFNANSHALVNSWQQITLQALASLGYGYYSNGVKNLIFASEYAPHLSLWDPITNENNGSFLEPYNTQWSPHQVDVDLPSDFVYVHCSGSVPVKRSNYPVTAWYNLISPLGYSIGGIATGWARLFLSIGTPGFNQVYQYLIDGTYESTINVNGLDTGAILGDAAIGRVNAVGDHESLFIAVSYPSNPSASGICEIEIGNITGVSVIPTSLGSIKASFK